MVVTIRIPGVYCYGIHVVVCKLGPPDVWYRGGEIKKKNKKGKSQPKSAQSMLCYGLHILKYINAKIIIIKIVKKSISIMVSFLDQDPKILIRSVCDYISISRVGFASGCTCKLGAGSVEITSFGDGNLRPVLVLIHAIVMVNVGLDFSMKSCIDLADKL